MVRGIQRGESGNGRVAEAQRIVDCSAGWREVTGCIGLRSARCDAVLEACLDSQDLEKIERGERRKHDGEVESDEMALVVCE